MTEPTPPVAWKKLMAALDSGDIARIRTAIAGLDGKSTELLEKRLGTARVDRVRRTVRRSRETQRRALQGRVIVIHGIMGAQLDVVQSDGESDRVWVKYGQLLNGRIADLELADGVHPKDPSLSVRVSGIFPEYLPLLLELDQIWQVTPFAFDWRLDIDTAAAQLAELVGTWANGEPCHIVAHSMGGLVARRMTQLFPQVWASMADPDQRKRGGRLIQLGTPNRGSFAIPLMLTGEEPLVRKLALLDRKHKLAALRPILATFPGPYQMMPAPASGTDDRDRLYKVATWGSTAPVDDYLHLARRFHKAMETIVSPEAIVYVAGYDQNTPYRIKVTKPGTFEYQVTRNGDGRVPHELGLLDGVRTLWVREKHGALAGNDSVLAGIHTLLQTGNTVELEQSVARSRDRAPSGWQKLDLDDWQDDIQTFESSLPPAAKRRTSKPSAENVEVESLLLSGFVEAPPPEEVGAEQDVPDEPTRAAAAKPKKPIKIEIQVICGDITKVDADVYAVGHYVGVLPQAAEYALDTVVSAKDAPPEARVLSAHTRLGLLRGELGEISRYPWANNTGRLVAVAGMGYPGTFGPGELRTLANKLTLDVTGLPSLKSIATVLIGSGAGNLPVGTCVRQLLLGVVDALRYRRTASEIDAIKIVERDLAKAHEIHDLVTRFANESATADTLAIELHKRVEVDASAHATRQLVVPMALASLVAASKAGPKSAARKAVDELLSDLPGSAAANRNALQQISKLAGSANNLDDLAGRLTISVRDRSTEERDDQAPTRFSIVRDGNELVAAALADTAIVPQRILKFDLRLFDELAIKATDPVAEEASDLGLLATRLLIPNDFLPLLTRGAALVAELDRYTATMPWEFLAAAEGIDGQSTHFALARPFARQLRTSYSGSPSVKVSIGDSPRALVIGDPGDPNAGDDLPGARKEAIAVVKYLKSVGIEVDARIGAPSARLKGYKAAGRLEVLKLLLCGKYDLVHYCGHGDFDKTKPDSTGWLFEDGLLTAGEIESIQRPPRLIVANACLSGRVSERLEGGAVLKRSARDATLLPTLADEFFRRGVRDYIGTAWEVSDDGAIEFATCFYQHVFGRHTTFGEALVAARNELFKKSDSYDALWAAYQHYGDPGAAFSRTNRPRK